MIVSASNYIEPVKVADEFEVWVGYLLNQSAQRIRTATVVALEPLAISPPQLRALEAIAEAQPLNQVKLGSMLDMDRSTIVHLIDHFERHGFASREADLSDRRSHAIVLTTKGRQILVAGRALARAVETDFLAPLTQSERQAFLILLQKLFDPIPRPKEKEREPSTAPSDA